MLVFSRGASDRVDRPIYRSRLSPVAHSNSSLVLWILIFSRNYNNLKILCGFIILFFCGFYYFIFCRREREATKLMFAEKLLTNL